MDKNDPDFDQDETVAQERAREDSFHQLIRSRYGRGRDPRTLYRLINNTIRYFHPDRRYDECLPSMMAQRRELVTLIDRYPTQNIIMNTEEEDILLTRVRCLRHVERPSLNTYDIWIRMHRRNNTTGVVECAVMRGPVVMGIRTTRDRPFAFPIWASNGRPTGSPAQQLIVWDAYTRRRGGVQSLGGDYVTTITHSLSDPVHHPAVQIGIFTLTQVRELFPIIGVMYAMNYQLLESHEATDWLWIRSYIERIEEYNTPEQEHHQFNLRRPSL
jgi:hypothetical protein